VSAKDLLDEIDIEKRYLLDEMRIERGSLMPERVSARRIKRQLRRSEMDLDATSIRS
jgi:hypothetical protein